jgi:hypothetical protein
MTFLSCIIVQQSGMHNYYEERIAYILFICKK